MCLKWDLMIKFKIISVSENEKCENLKNMGIHLIGLKTGVE